MSGQRELALDGSKPPAPPIPQVKLPHSGRNITLGTADRWMQLCSSQLVLAVPIGAICLLTMGSCAIYLAVCASLREPLVCTQLRYPGILLFLGDWISRIQKVCTASIVMVQCLERVNWHISASRTTHSVSQPPSVLFLPHLPSFFLTFTVSASPTSL